MKKLEHFQKGVNLGGWLSQGSLEKEHKDTFISEKDIETIASWGADHVRLPVDFENIETESGEERPDGYVYIDNCISWCRKYGLNIVLDLHKTCGYVFDDQEYSQGFFDSRELQDRFVNLWKRLAARYAKDSDIAMFDILNEVVDFNAAEKWNEIATRCMKAIREIAPDAKLLFGGVGNNAVSAVKLLAPPIDENVVYSCHCYSPLLFTHQSAYWVKGMPADFNIGYPESYKEYCEKSESLFGSGITDVSDYKGSDRKTDSEYFDNIFKEAVEAAEKQGVALYCGEYGVIDKANVEDTLRWFGDIHKSLEKYGIGRAVWSYKEMDFGLTDKRYDGVREELVKLL
ncbi:MAG: glycoside hydrolase family 5 protein [Firmicutes bacterium]|nr:glycoside hydrolase family 5 protein [[Eubacterium] siraeum]MCM1487363.1 glycoside hydrolase family 5 protein [Bacillota bacterium]